MKNSENLVRLIGEVASVNQNKTEDGKNFRVVTIKVGTGDKSMMIPIVTTGTEEMPPVGSLVLIKGQLGVRQLKDKNGKKFDKFGLRKPEFVTLCKGSAPVDFNEFILIGRLGFDPEPKVTKAGTPLSTIGIAVTDSRKVGDEWKDETTWFNLDCFGFNKDKADRLCKGDLVEVSGSVYSKQSTVESKTYYKVGLFVNKLTALTHTKRETPQAQTTVSTEEVPNF